MKKEFTSSLRKKDYIANLAIILFLIILVLEILLVSWLPSKLSTEKLWDRQVALQEAIDLEDFLRRYIRGDVKYQNSWQEGEAFMGLSALDVLAKYIRTNRATLTREQIRGVFSTLTKFESYYKKWNKGTFFITFEEIKIDPVLQKQMHNYQTWVKQNDTDKK